MRTRMTWDWVGEYPVFIYTTFLDHFKFNVKVVIGKKDDQNAPGYGPAAKPNLEYIQEGMMSKKEVTNQAFKYAKTHIRLWRA